MGEDGTKTKVSTASSKRWSEFMDTLCDSLPSVQAEIFGRRLDLVEESDQQVTASVPRPMIKDWLEENFKSVMNDTFQSVYGDEVEFCLVANGSNGDNQSSSDSNKNSQSVNRSFPFGKDVELNPRYKFENFVVGSGNEYAYTAARHIAEDPTTSYNPLFIYGGVGLGKTHLLQAVGHQVKQQWEQANVEFLSAEQFTNEIIDALRNNKKKDFKYRYRNVDMFLVDDVQFFAGKESSQEEFFHTFNTLYENGKGTVFCSDRPPQEISHIEERLRNRFEMGLMVDIQPPDYETRLAILQDKADQEGIRLPNELLDWIARNVTRNVRRLEGCLSRLAMMGNFNAENLDIDHAKQRLRDLVTPQEEAPPVLTFDQVMEEVSDHFSVSISDLKSRRRTKAIAEPRQVAMYLCRKLTNRSYADIGQEFGGRDHSTVMHAEEKIGSALQEGSPLARHVRTLKQNLAS